MSAALSTENLLSPVYFHSIAIYCSYYIVSTVTVTTSLLPSIFFDIVG